MLGTIIYDYQNTTYVPDIVLSVLQILSYLILPPNRYDTDIPIIPNLQ